jgi:hypothetical protein
MQDKIFNNEIKIDVAIPKKSRIITIPKKYLEIIEINPDIIHLTLKIFDSWYEIDLNVQNKEVQPKILFPAILYKLLNKPKRVKLTDKKPGNPILSNITKKVYMIPILE